jgi:LPXTG-motif cell wall-anchored protein
MLLAYRAEIGVGLFMLSGLTLMAVVASVYFRRHRRNKAFFGDLVHTLLPEKGMATVSGGNWELG